MMYFENPGCKLTDAQKLRIHKIYCPEEVLQPIVPAWNKLHKSASDRSKSYVEKAELARKEFAPYRAFCVVNETQDESNVVENFTPDSLVLVLNNVFENGKWHNQETLMSRDEYLDNRWDKLADFRQPFVHDEDWLHQFDIDCAEFDLTTDPVNLRESDRTEYFLTKIYSKSNKFMVNVDHFDCEKVEEEIEYAGLSISEKAKANRSSWSKEYVRQLLETRKAWENWIAELLESGQVELAEEVKALHQVQNVKTCPVCGHKFSNDRAKCPICHVENETYAGDLQDRNPDWFADTGDYDDSDAYDDFDSEF